MIAMLSKSLAIVSVVVIVAVLVYSIFGIIAAQNLIFRLSDYDRFEYFLLTNPGTIEACSTVPVFATISNVRVAAHYGEEDLGQMEFSKIFVLSNSVSSQEGMFYSADSSSVQYILLAMDAQNSKTSPIRIDPSVFTIKMQAQTPLLGIIPYSVESVFTGYEFSDMMNSGKWC